MSAREGSFDVTRVVNDDYKGLLNRDVWKLAYPEDVAADNFRDAQWQTLFTLGHLLKSYLTGRHFGREHTGFRQCYGLCSFEALSQPTQCDAKRSGISSTGNGQVFLGNNDIARLCARNSITRHPSLHPAMSSDRDIPPGLAAASPEAHGRSFQPHHPSNLTACFCSNARSLKPISNHFFSSSMQSLYTTLLV